MKITATFLIISALGLMSCAEQQRQKLIFPYSQWTIGTGGRNVVWQYAEGLEGNNSFIAAPDAADWDEWFETITEYRSSVRSKIGREVPALLFEYPSGQESKMHFDRFSYQLNLTPGEELEFSGWSKSTDLSYSLLIDFDLKSKGEEKSYVIRKNIQAVDSIYISSSGEWTSFSIKTVVPQFSPDSFSIAPSLRLSVPESEKSGSIAIKDLHLHASPDDARRELLNTIDAYISRQVEHASFLIPEELSWTHGNFLMGFVFIWDHTFFDPVRGEYLVDEYCKTMEREFGGLQSVILWHSYPNIGVDEKNQFDYFEALPGGIGGLKNVVDDFHRNGVRVFITYNPWDLDTRRSELHDFQELARIIDVTGADGIFLDTWKSSKGSISIFDVESSIRDEVTKYGKAVAFTTEILPEFKDLTGPDALTSSWGQEIEPLHYTDLSHQKWLMPTHKQYYIKRMAVDRRPILTHAWINGQGIQLWENIFGTMNLWQARYRQALRKMNAIWKMYGSLYLTDDWKPFIPLTNTDVIASQWKTADAVITNFVDTLEKVSVLKWEVSDDPSFRYFDLWNGTELKPEAENGRRYLKLNIREYGCVLQVKSESDSLRLLLSSQARESRNDIPAVDDYNQELSIKLPLQYAYNLAADTPFSTDLREVDGANRLFNCKHIWREGRCYPNLDAAHNHDLVISRESGAQYILHTHRDNIPPFAVMPRAVTNGQYDEFLKATGYAPRFPQNFLKHWNGRTCPEEIINEPVVYVSLEDARAFAEWAGMRLPSEWEWQLAAETLQDQFLFNEVFEWNESERSDGYNRFVNLRGGCSRWVTPSSWWYLPSAPRGELPGGPQKYDSHVKYFLMYPGIDRASTIGFRCIER